METVATKPLTLNTLQKHFYIAIAIALGTGVVSGVGTGIGVYYKTVDKVNEHTTIITKLTTNVDAITVILNDLKTQTAVDATAPAYQQKQIDGLNVKMDKLENKIDKLQETINNKFIK